MMTSLRAILLVALAPTLVQAQEVASGWTELSGMTPAHFRVIWTENPCTRATISWSTAAEGAEHVTYLSSSSRSGELEDYELRIPTHRDGLYSRKDEELETQPPAWYHHARAEDLEPSTTYWFVVASDGVVSPEFHFVTAPEDDRPFKLLYGGDSRSDERARCTMNRMMSELSSEDPSILAFAHGGDYILDGRRWDMWRTWLSNHELCISDSRRVVPIIPVRGNHDFGPLYGEIFDDPGEGQPDYYFTQLGEQAAIITLNSEISTAGDQALWLRKRLEELRPLNRWLLAQYHRPIYPAVKNPGRAKASWVPLFEEFDLDLVLESDGHVIKRTVPIRDEKHDPTGVTYIGEGGLGVPQRVPDGSRWYLQAPGMADSGNHVTLLEFRPDSLRMTTLGPRAVDAKAAPPDFAELVPQGAEWAYLAGSDPAQDWAGPGFDDSHWPRGPAGFGYGDDDDLTVLEDMRRSFGRVYLRYELSPAELEHHERLGLMIRYDDEFIAYWNGVEFQRSGTSTGSGAKIEDIGSHEARQSFEFFALPSDWAGDRGRAAVLASEGHNVRLSSSDFTLDPYLMAAGAEAEHGETEKYRQFDDHRLLPRE